MKVKKLCKIMPEGHRVLVAVDFDEETGEPIVFDGCTSCVTEEFGDDKVKKIFSADDAIVIITEESGIDVSFMIDDDWDYDEEDY